MLQAAKQVNGLQHAGVQVAFKNNFSVIYFYSDFVLSGIMRNISWEETSS